MHEPAAMEAKEPERKEPAAVEPEKKEETDMDAKEKMKKLMEPKAKGEKKRKVKKRRGSDNQYDNTEYLEKIENNMTAMFEKMMEEKVEADQKKKEEEEKVSGSVDGAEKEKRMK